MTITMSGATEADVIFSDESSFYGKTKSNPGASPHQLTPIQATMTNKRVSRT
jgi:hypothetical protein